MWLFEGIRRYYGGLATHEYVAGSGQYAHYFALCTPANQVGGETGEYLRDRKFETRSTATTHAIDDATVKKIRTRIVRIADGSLTRDQRSIRVTAPPTRSDKIVRSAWLTLWSAVALNGLVLLASFGTGAEVGPMYKSLLGGFPSKVERSDYVRCREEPLVEQVSVCRDGWISRSSGSGTCSWHGGVSHRDEIERERGKRECMQAFVNGRQ